MELTSPAFKQGQAIPRRHTCDGQDISPALAWTGVPEKTASLALVCDDPDAPVGVWDHWILFNIPARTPGLAENIPRKPQLPDGSCQGNNSWGRLGYGGPCPPRGAHRYFFRLYALGAALRLRPGATKDALLKAMRQYVLDQAELMGIYAR